MSQKIERTQTGIRIEKRLLKVLKGLAESLDMTLGDLIEGMALHSFENKPAFSEETLVKIKQLKIVYDLDWTADDSHRFKEDGE
ncbi:hypothetical protein [Ruegeria sp. A3M17]|uniref:hypothetical protein n=1 Tax=Ruegeria sp. A3M17 TaxID=2267229 RepID=UPI000DE987F3|nr:hypothetical protein [Ruegeria sp. A3M17]RBW55143.1 hypothetical protein DS906_14945 [Ruegeria sp. A3M17]